MKTLHILSCSLFAFAACKKAESKPAATEEAVAKPVEAPAEPEVKPEPKPEAKPEVKAEPPTNEQAVAVVKKFVEVVTTLKPEQVRPLLASDFELVLNHSHSTEHCIDAPIVKASSPEELDKMATCLVYIDLSIPAKKVSAKSIGAEPTVEGYTDDSKLVARPGEVWVNAAYTEGHEYALSARVALRDGKAMLTGAAIDVQLYDD